MNDCAYIRRRFVVHVLGRRGRMQRQLGGVVGCERVDAGSMSQAPRIDEDYNVSICSTIQSTSILGPLTPVRLVAWTAHKRKLALCPLQKRNDSS